MATELTPFEQAKAKMLELEEALLQKAPKMPYILRDVHNFFKGNPETVTIFKDEPTMCATLIAALQRQVTTQIVAKQSKSSTTGAKAIKNASAGDLGF